ncbi:MAG: MBL fold metallo-hydrolase [Bacteroidota bacterium]
MEIRIATSVMFQTGLMVFLAACQPTLPQQKVDITSLPASLNLVVLGNVQDAGSPHIGCEKDCCKELFLHPDPNRKVVSLGVIDTTHQQKWIFDATPDLPTQMDNLNKLSPFRSQKTPDGIFLTHAHIGHYAGLMFLGKEGLGASGVPVYAMPRMKNYLENNGPWDQLTVLENISINKMQEDSAYQLSSSLSVKPFLVPHRDEYSETVGYLISGPSKSALFIPDIDKWNTWEKDIQEEIKKVDFAFLDATFYNQAEIPHRDMAEIPHPFIVESMELFKDLPPEEKQKVYFIHLNHTNPALVEGSEASLLIKQNGYQVARKGMMFGL